MRKIFIKALIGILSLFSLSVSYSQEWKDAHDAYANKEYVKAFAIFEKLAKEGNANAGGMLGMMYEFGQGRPKNMRMAVSWYEKVAEKDPLVWLNLAAAYKDGDGVVKNENKAYYWYQKSADIGFAIGQRMTGYRYVKGIGVPKNLQTGYYWLLLSASQGDSTAVKLIEILEPLLTPKQRLDAQDAAANWKPKLSSAGNSSTNPSSTLSPERPPSTLTKTGSGFKVSPGYFLTNYHVIDGCVRIMVNGVEAKHFASDAKVDLALLSAAGSGPVAVIRLDSVKIGEQISVAGFPLRSLLSGFNMTTGSVSSLSGYAGDSRIYQITAPVQAGNSGGPVLDATGKVSGVVVAKLNSVRTAELTGDVPQNVNFAIGGGTLRAFLDRNKISYSTVGSDSILSPVDIAERAKGFTVLIECWSQ